MLGIGPGGSVLDLGCGKGGNLAHVATLGARAVGVDVSAAQLQAVRERWAPYGLELHEDDALAALARQHGEFDAVYSVFGAVWFVEPAELLPAIRRALRPGGVLAFSHRPPAAGCFGPQASYIQRGEAPLVVRRWDYEPERWCELLHEHGFARARAEVVAPPPGPHTAGTLLVRAERH